LVRRGWRIRRRSRALFAAGFAGERTRLRREHIANLENRVRRTERDAERERLLASAEERAGIARDLHDSAATRSA
jgi:signal transduction histidine kinase